MFVLFGFGHTKVKKVGETKVSKCSNCSNTRAFDIVERSKWFTLFFIPVFPYSKEKAIVCPVCKSIKKADVSSQPATFHGKTDPMEKAESDRSQEFKAKEEGLKKSLENNEINLNEYKKQMNLLKFDKNGSLNK